MCACVCLCASVSVCKDGNTFIFAAGYANELGVGDASLHRFTVCLLICVRVPGGFYRPTP